MADAEKILSVTCPKCGKPAGDGCYDIDGEFPVGVDPHPERVALADE